MLARDKPRAKQQIRQTAKEFLGALADGDAGRAKRLLTDPANAQDIDGCAELAQLRSGFQN